MWKPSLFLASLFQLGSAHYIYSWVNVNGVNSTYWEYTRTTNNWQNLGPVTNVKSADMTCYDTAVASYTGSAPVATSVPAGTKVSIGADPGGVCCGSYHQSVSLVYMAQVPSGTNAATWEPSGAVWFKVGEVPPITDGGTSITWVAMNEQYLTFTIPAATPSGTYLVRAENIALHSASSYGGAQFYISCSIIQVTNGGSGTPGPLVAFPGAYTGNEPGILIDIYYPIPATYTMPGPPIWPGGSSTSGPTTVPTTVKTSSSSSTQPTSSSKTTTTTTKTTTASGSSQTAYGQCGGSGYSGPTTCVSGYTCKSQSAYYSQCLPN